MPESVAAILAASTPLLSDHEELYRHLHVNPELSNQEYETAALVAQWLGKCAGFRVQTHIGGTGVVGTLRNGSGRTVLLRAELDALPVREATGLPYSSTKTAVDLRTGLEAPVMHACGHDMHIASLLCVAKILATNTQLWAGTLVVLFQPSEEDGGGAQSMVDDGLYDLNRHAVPSPDFILAGHLMPRRAGQVRTRVGVVNGAVHSLKVIIYGRGGHGARPQNTVDPVVVGSSIVMNLQTVVSRSIAPTESAVVTIGSFHAGHAENIIGEEAELRINIRSLREDTLRSTIEAVHRIIEGECKTFGCPKPPTFEYIGGFPLLNNDAPLTTSVIARFKEHFHDRYEEEEYPSLGAEDLCNLATEQSQCCFWNIGCIDPATWDAATIEGSINQIPGNHSSQFAPVIQPTLFTAVEAFVVATTQAFADV